MRESKKRSSANSFRKMHHEGILVLPCVWDCASAKIFEDAGFPAIATTSSGIAYSHGLPDGQRIEIDTVIDVIQRISDTVSIPLSVDLEAGYGSTHEEVLTNVNEVIEAGAIGINIEDGTGQRAHPLVDPSHQAELIASIRDLSDDIGIPLVVNARTDAYLTSTQSSATRFETAVHRSNTYLNAGADCAFVIGVSERGEIRRLTEAIDGPVNIMANSPEMPSIKELERLGVSRVSLGGGPMQATLGQTRRIAEELLSEGSFSYLAGAVSRKEIEQLF